MAFTVMLLTLLKQKKYILLMSDNHSVTTLILNVIFKLQQIADQSGTKFNLKPRQKESLTSDS